MDTKYTDYIDSLEGSGELLAGRCKPVRDQMIERFPELRATQGRVTDGVNRRWHYWAVTDEDEMIDPTASQFENVLWYEEADVDELWVEHGLDPDLGAVSKCQNCGSLTQNGFFCSDRCSEEGMSALRQAVGTSL